MSMKHSLTSKSVKSIGVASITQLRTCVMKILYVQGRSPNAVSDFKYHNAQLLKARIRFLLERIISFERRSHFEKGRN